jgi:hypothetical protein
MPYFHRHNPVQSHLITIEVRDLKKFQGLSQGEDSLTKEKCGAWKNFRVTLMGKFQMRGREDLEKRISQPCCAPMSTRIGTAMAISIQFQFDFDQFRFNFDSISIRFRFNFDSISIRF